MTPDQELKALANSWTLAKDKRICAICLQEVDRATHSQHMDKEHGYEIVELRPYSEEEWNKLQESKGN